VRKGGMTMLYVLELLAAPLGLLAVPGAAALLASLWRGPGVRTPDSTDLD